MKMLVDSIHLNSYVTKEIEDIDVPCTGIALNTNTLAFTGSDTQTLTVTKHQVIQQIKLHMQQTY
ncbi:MAG: hypothetical protein ACLRQZ_07770 [Clostridia bacterium]